MCSRVTTYYMRKCASFVFFNLIVVIEQAFVGMASDLNDLVVQLSSVWPQQIFWSIDWKSIFLRGLEPDTTNFMRSHSGFGLPNISFRTRNYGQIHQTGGSHFQRSPVKNSSKSLTGSLRLPSVAYISCGAFRCLKRECFFCFFKIRES